MTRRSSAGQQVKEGFVPEAIPSRTQASGTQASGVVRAPVRKASEVRARVWSGLGLALKLAPTQGCGASLEKALPPCASPGSMGAPANAVGCKVLPCKFLHASTSAEPRQSPLLTKVPPTPLQFVFLIRNKNQSQTTKTSKPPAMNTYPPPPLLTASEQRPATVTARHLHPVPSAGTKKGL